MIPFSALITPLTSTQIRAQFVTSLKSLGIPADQWNQGGAASSVLTIMSSALASFQNLVVQAIASQFLDLATGSWLVLLAFYTFGVTVPPATFASGSLVLTNSGGGVYTYGIGVATFLNPATGQTYTNQTAISLGALASQTITVQATQSGSQGSAAPGAINTIVTVMLGVTCTNPSSVIGLDQMSDASVRTLCRNKQGVLSVRGPASAYRYAVQTAVGAISGLPVNINRSTVPPSSSTGVVTVYVASPSGPASTDDVNGVINNIAVVAQPDCVTVDVINSTGIPYGNTLTVWCNSNGVPTATLLLAVENALDLYFSVYPISGLHTDAGEGLFASGVNGVVGQAITDAGGTIVSVEGATDLALTAGQVATDNTTVIIRTTAS